uniref:Ig-like domain-containing protein n=1 Tax=Esox lucius TaxID=8010 RepID=A0A6Q2Z2N1_ESOLU
MNPGDSVTLICEVKESSTGWRFSWYKTVLYRAGLPSLLDKSYSVEPLSGNETTKESYTLSPAGPTDTGGYVCRAGRGDPVFYTNYSEPQFLWSGVLHSSMSVRISPNRTQHFTSKSLSLTCDLKGNSTGWRLMRYTETGVESGCSPNWGSITGSTCTITSTDTEDSGVYWCESGSGQYSNAVNITVSGGDVILESPVHPVTEGDSLTLLCTHRNQPHTNTKADFYKDGVLISNDSIQEMTIPTVSKSDEGFYKCKSDQIESPESWVTVRVPGSSTSVLVEVIVGLVVAVVLLTIFLVLLCQYKHNKGFCSNRIFWPIHPQSTNQDPQQDQGSTQVQSPDAGYTDSAGVSADGSSDVTYAQIQLNKMDKKQKEKPADPNENPVYSEMKTVKTAASSGPVDVTYSETDLKKMVKTQKKKKSTSLLESESVYSPIKTQ